MPTPHFTDDTLRFLKALTQNNDREWFRTRKDRYETHIRNPMIEVIERLALDLPAFAPELVASPKVSMYRIYRDTRFSANKAPLKTQVAAIFPHRELTKHDGAGLYFHLTPDELMIGGGIYAPEPKQLHRLRDHVAANTGRFRTIVESPAFHRAFGAVSGARLQRVPRGFDPAHPAAAYLTHKQFLAGCTLPATKATSPRFYGLLVRRFELIAPFIRFLNESLAGHRDFPL